MPPYIGGNSKKNQISVMRFNQNKSLSVRKVAFVLPAYRAGGMEVSMFRIAGYFKKCNWQVTMLATEEPGEWFNRISGLGFKPVFFRNFTAIEFVRHVRTVGQYLAVEKFDLIFTVFDRFSQAAIGWVNDSTLVVPLLRNDHPEVYEIGLANSQLWNVAVGNSPKVCEVARKIRPEKKVLLIPNGVEVAPYRHRKWSARRPLNLLFVGRLVHESKRVLLLPKIMRMAIDLGLAVHLRIAGDGPDRDALQRSIGDLGVDGCCELLGPVAEPRLMQLYDAADAVLFLSAYEGFPNVLLEAMARGCIPISTRLAGITDYLIDHGSSGFLVGLDDVSGIVGVLNDLATIEDGSRLSFMAWQTTQKRFSTEIENSAFMQIMLDFNSGCYQIKKSRRPVLCWHLFTGIYAYRRIIKPHLSPVYLAIKKLFPRDFPWKRGA
jgi:glycosyltransferase involved in cell wall biosynthesis